MSATTLIPVGEYLRTTYRPDRDYVDGEVLERNGGEQDHSYLQAMLAAWLTNQSRAWGVWVYTEQRVQVAATRFRIPDICIVAGARRPGSQIFGGPPHACIEILSKDDSLPAMLGRINDYTAVGVRNVWLIDPRGRRAWAVSDGRLSESEDLVLRSSEPVLVVP